MRRHHQANPFTAFLIGVFLADAVLSAYRSNRPISVSCPNTNFASTTPKKVNVLGPSLVQKG